MLRPLRILAVLIFGSQQERHVRPQRPHRRRWRQWTRRERTELGPAAADNLVFPKEIVERLAEGEKPYPFLRDLLKRPRGHDPRNHTKLYEITQMNFVCIWGGFVDRVLV